MTTHNQVTFAQLQAIRERRAREQRLARIEAANRQLRRKLDVLECPDLPQRELNDRVIRFAASERRAGRNVNYELARQAVLHAPPQQRKASNGKSPATRADLAAAAVQYALANRINYAEARQRVLA